MQNQYDLKRYAVLYVDDEEKALKYFEKTFGDEFRILTANNAADGLKIIEQRGEEIGVLLSDQRMPGEKGVQLLERARQLRPRLVRMMVTAYADYDVTVEAVNLGSIFRYISKPIQVDDVRNTLHRAMEFYILQQERDDLLREKLSVLQNLLITDRVMGLGVVAAGLNQHLNQPLRAVHAFLDLTPGRLGQQNFVLDRLREATFWRDFHGHVVQQSSRIAELLGELQSASGAEHKIDAAAVIQAVIEQLRSAFTAKGIELKFEPTGPLPALQVNRPSFEKMLHLLLQTELAMLPTGAHVTLSAQTAAEAADAGSLHLTLTDNGPGLSSDVLRSVFDPFYTHADAGTEGPGLTLMGAFLLAYHHGGRITSPRTAKGLILDILLPAVAPVPLAPAESSREFITNVLMNDVLWERLLPNG
ncbi:hybrid sensor histidine kinase/response regulator [Prosthecobacter sp.]|uniref:hybrid sensor histidine kinase/response regulator n=1 Tax=Prosthecobacter sp. TaxID=1965333 RepID=UPI002AB88856|nr:hybrid sensor histidine kinase/response regulator [Prosthecobacter sp.]MDZ4404534.1 hybrid sensor histidine kinase/response regulator [Prosthecobacter sp.]